MRFLDGIFTGIRNALGFEYDNSTTTATATAHASLLDGEAASELANAETTHEAVEQGGQAANTIADGASAGMTLGGAGMAANAAGGLMQGGGKGAQGILEGVGDLKVKKSQAENIRKQGNVEAEAANIDRQVAGGAAHQKLVQTELQETRQHLDLVDQRVGEGLELVEEELEKAMVDYFDYPPWLSPKVTIAIATSGWVEISQTRTLEPTD
jgi:hypothetical protein